MTITAHQQLKNAYNGFVQDFVDDRERDAATYKEAVDIADRSVELGCAVYRLLMDFDCGDIDHKSDLVLDAICDDIDLDQCIAALAISAAIEESAK